MARNVIHGVQIDNTRLRTSFVPPVQGHIIRDWVAKHPRIVIPVIVFFLGTLTYTVRGIPRRMFLLPTFARFSIPYVYLWWRERFSSGLLIKVFFVI